jgi:hypothetical protein
MRGAVEEVKNGGNIGELIRVLEERGSKLTNDKMSKYIESEIQKAEIPISDLENVALLLKSTNDVLRLIGALSLLKIVATNRQVFTDLISKNHEFIRFILIDSLYKETNLYVK